MKMNKREFYGSNNLLSKCRELANNKTDEENIQYSTEARKLGIVAGYFGKIAAIESFKVPNHRFVKYHFKSLPQKHLEKGESKQ